MQSHPERAKARPLPLPVQEKLMMKQLSKATDDTHTVHTGVRSRELPFWTNCTNLVFLDCSCCPVPFGREHYMFKV